MLAGAPGRPRTVLTSAPKAPAPPGNGLIRSRAQSPLGTDPEFGPARFHPRCCQPRESCNMGGWGPWLYAGASRLTWRAGCPRLGYVGRVTEDSRLLSASFLPSLTARSVGLPERETGSLASRPCRCARPSPGEADWRRGRVPLVSTHLVSFEKGQVFDASIGEPTTGNKAHSCGTSCDSIACSASFGRTCVDTNGRVPWKGPGRGQCLIRWSRADRPGLCPARDRTVDTAV